MPNPTDDVNRMVRTVIEAADPALRPVKKLPRFVVKRVELVAAGSGAPGDGRATRAGTHRSPGQPRTGAANAGK
jgi:hypothetical protein